MTSDDKKKGNPIPCDTCYDSGGGERKNDIQEVVRKMWATAGKEHVHNPISEVAALLASIRSWTRALESAAVGETNHPCDTCANLERTCMVDPNAVGPCVDYQRAERIGAVHASAVGETPEEVALGTPSLKQAKRFLRYSEDAAKALNALGTAGYVADAVGEVVDYLEKMATQSREDVDRCDCDQQCHSDCTGDVAHRYCETCYQASMAETFTAGKEKGGKSKAHLPKAEKCPTCGEMAKSFQPFFSPEEGKGWVYTGEGMFICPSIHVWKHKGKEE